jgi:hypothetical protein
VVPVHAVRAPITVRPKRLSSPARTLLHNPGSGSWGRRRGVIFRRFRLISTGLKFNLDADSSPWKERFGQILLFDFNNPTKGASPLMIESPQKLKFNRRQFNPHGLGSWVNADGTISLFVINHLDDYSTVERFTYNLQRPSILHHEETIKSPAFHLISDIAATGTRSFYYINAFRNRALNSILQKLEMYFSMNWGSIGHCMRHQCGKVVPGLRMPTGITMSNDKRLLYLAHSGIEAIEVYEIGEHHTLTLKQAWLVETAINNISLDPETGDLWTGGTPVFYKSFYHSRDPLVPCPSQVLHFKTNKDGKIMKMREVYSEDGNRFVSLSTAALCHSNKLLIGSAFNKAAFCEVLYSG